MTPAALVRQTGRMKDRHAWLLAVVTLASLACRRPAPGPAVDGGEGAAPPVAAPPRATDRGDGRAVATHLYATVQASCAPWDGAAERIIIFTGVGGGCTANVADIERIELMLWRRGIPLRTGTVKLDGASGDGAASACSAGKRCAPLEGARVRIDTVGAFVVGELVMATPAGEVATGFRAERCPGTPICG